MIIRKLGLCLILVFIGFKGVSQDYSKYQDELPEEILARSWRSFSIQEKKSLRFYLKSNFPSTAEGIFSSAYLANLDGNEEDAKLLYQKCLENYPNHLPSLANLSSSVAENESILLINRMLKIDSSFMDYSPLKRKYNYLQGLDDKNKVIDYLNRLSEKMPEHYLEYFLRARYYENARDYDEAKINYEKALIKNFSDFDVVRNYVNFGLNKMTNPNSDLNDRYHYFRAIVDFYIKDDIDNVYKAEAALFGAEKLEQLNSENEAFNYYLLSFDNHPTSEAVEGVYRNYRHKSDEEIPLELLKSFLLNSEKVLPNNSRIENILGYFYLTEELNRTKSKKYYLSSINNAVTFQDSLNFAVSMSKIYYEFAELNPEESSDLVKKFLSTHRELTATDKYKIYLCLYNISMQGLDFNKALNYLEKANRTGRLKESYYQAKKNELLTYIDNFDSQFRSSATPSIVATTVLKPNNTFCLDTEDRFGAIGNNPLQLWDFQNRRKVDNLGQGGYFTSFSPNGDYIATISKESRPGGWISSGIYIYEVKTRKVLHQIPAPTNQAIEKLSWNPESSKIVYCTDFGQLFVYDLKQNRKTHTQRMGSRQITGPLLWHKSGKWIFTAQAKADNVKIFKASDLTLEKKLNGVSWPHALGQTSDGRYLICSDNQRVLSVWDVQEDWARKYQKDIGQSAKNIVAHPFEPIVIINSFSREKNYPIVTFNVEEGAVIDSTSSRISATQMKISKDGNRVFMEGLNSIDVLTFDGLKTLDKIEGESDYAYFSAKDEKNDYYISVDEEGVKVWNILNGRKVFTWLGKPSYFHAIEGETSKFLVTFDNQEQNISTLYLYDSSNLSKTTLHEFDFRVDKIAESKDLLVLAMSEFPDQNNNVTKGRVSILNKQNFEISKSVLNIDLVEDYLEYEGKEVPRAGFAAIDVSNDGNDIIYSTKWQDSFGRPFTFSKKCRFIDVHEEKVMLNKTKTVDYSIKGLKFEGKSEDYFRIESSSFYQTYRRSDSKFHQYFSEGVGVKAITTAPNDTIKFNLDYIVHIKNSDKTVVRYPYSNLKDVEVFSDKNLLVAITNLNEIEFYNLNNLSKKLTVISKRNGEYISYTPTGQFVHSPNGVNRVIWTLEDNYLELEAMTHQNKKGIIREQLKAIFNHGNYDLPNTINNSNFPPNIQFDINDSNETSFYDKSDYVFEYSIRLPNGIDEPSQEIYLNGILIDSELIKKSKIDDFIYYKINLKLFGDINHLQVFQLYNDLKIVGVEKMLYSSAKVKETDNLPRLWIFGVGISSYKNETKSLKFAHKDVEDIISTFEKQEGLTFSEVIVHSNIIDSNATRNNIRRKLYRLNQKIEDQDVVLVYYSGHGEIINNKLSILPWNIDFDDPIEAYPVMDLIKFGSDRASEEARTIVMLDMCSAGVVEKEVFGNRINSYNTGAGLTVFASSFDAGDLSYEEQRFSSEGNGAFTAAIIEGIEGAADKMDISNNNSEVDLYELSVFVTKRVDNLTDTRQTPRVSNIGNGKKFVISKF